MLYQQKIRTLSKVMLLTIITMLVICCNDDDTINEDPTTADLDGDGINYTNELLANTNPNDPCSYRAQDQNYGATSQAWRNLDCDGDGVTNGMELDPDGNNGTENIITNPKSACDLVVANQNTSPSDEWNMGNCDSDPFSNAREVLDNTDIFDTCDFLLGNQDLQPSQFWLDADCDNDGRTNGREIDNDTNPLDPSEFEGAGSILKEIYYGTKNNYTEKHSFIDGIYYDKIERADGSVITDFEYDNQNRLTSVFIDDDDEDITITYTYTNNQISNIVRVQGNDVYNLNVVYDGNFIYTYDGNELPGLYTQKYTFNSLNKLVSKEEFSSDGTSNRLETYHYDESFENLLSSELETRGYNSSTGEFFELWVGQGYLVNYQSYSYYEDNAINLLREPYQNISLNIHLSSLYYNSLKIHSRTFFNNLGCLSPKFLTQYHYSYSTGDYSDNFSIGYGTNNLQSNNLPSNIYLAYFGEYNYEVHYE